MDESLIFPRWSVPANVGALMSTRLGGVSKAPFNELNVGDNSSDVIEAVAENKRRLQEWISENNEGKSIPLGFLSQVHGTQILNLDEPQVRLEVASGKAVQADASYTTQPGIVCVIRVADCMPVLFSAPGIVAAVHAGWRGLAAGIIDKTVDVMIKKTACSCKQIHVWLGPCIGANAFEVGADVRDVFVLGDTENSGAFKPTDKTGKWLGNLQMLARFALARLGVDRIDADVRCTYEEEHLFFSYRRDHVRLGDTGRMAACIWLKG